VAGIASEYQFTSVLDYRLTGININQDDLPWWAYQILVWISMVHAVFNCPGENGSAHRAGMKRIVEKGRPDEVYKAYESYCLYYEQYADGRVK
jgi:hypothetical protein